MGHHVSRNSVTGALGAHLTEWEIWIYPLSVGLSLQSDGLLDATFDEEEGGCRISRINMVVQSATLLYGAVFDLAMMALIARKLSLEGSMTAVLLNLIRHPNLPYIFVAWVDFSQVRGIFSLVLQVYIQLLGHSEYRAPVASITNALQIFLRLNLNAIMASIFVFPSAVCSTINATRCVRRQINYRNGMEEESRQVDLG